MAALREAGDIEQTAALILGMWNRYQDAENPGPELAVKVLKNRGGSPNGRAVWAYDGNRYKIYPDGTAAGGAPSPQTTTNENPFKR
jgi:replicative DNA helicase